MRIGLDGRFWSPEAAGIARYSQELVKNLIKLDQKNKYFLFLLPEHFKNFNLKAKNLTPVEVTSPHYSLKEQFKLPFELNKIRLDFINFLNFNHPIFWQGKFVITFHDLTLYFYPARRGKIFFHQWAMKSVMKDAIDRAEKIIVPSKNTKQDILDHFEVEQDKIVVTYEGVPEEFTILDSKKIEKFKKDQKLNKPFLLYLGQWRPHKNLIKLIEAYEIIRNETDLNFQLVIGGKKDPDYIELIEKIEKSPYKKDIICPGFIPDEDIILWYNSATAFIFPSFYEGFGLPPLEAMACGTPVLASEISSMPEILGQAAMYFNPKNITEMAKNIIQVFRDRELRVELRKKGLEQVKKYSFKKMAKETLNVYNSISKK